MKFGGTSVGTPDAIKRLISIVSASKEPVAGVVVSAFSDVTNQLIKAAELASSSKKKYKEILQVIEKRHNDTVIAVVMNESLRKETLRTIVVMLSELEDILLGVFLLNEVNPKVLDTIMSFGERLSAYVVTQGFKDKNIAVELVDTRKLIKTDKTYGTAIIHMDQTNAKIKDFFQKSKKTIKIITGYIGSTENGETTTFGRGGSDYTASIFGAAIKA